VDVLNTRIGGPGSRIIIIFITQRQLSVGIVERMDIIKMSAVVHQRIKR